MKKNEVQSTLSNFHNRPCSSFKNSSHASSTDFDGCCVVATPTGVLAAPFPGNFDLLISVFFMGCGTSRVGPATEATADPVGSRGPIPGFATGGTSDRWILTAVGTNRVASRLIFRICGPAESIDSLDVECVCCEGMFTLGLTTCGKDVEIEY